jgi:hypothetical protein
MTIILPALHSKNLKLTGGERRFGTCLLRLLEDDYRCWVNVPVGPMGLRPDFIILHPGRGILVLEVKDWKLPTILEMNRHTADVVTDHGRKCVPNPIEQARSYAIAINNLLQRDPLLVQQEPGRYHNHLVLPWGYGVVFASITRRQFESAQLDQAIPGDKVICQDEMTEGADAEAFQGRLWGMFNYHVGRLLSLAQIDRVRHHLFPEIRIQPGRLFDGGAEHPGAAVPDVVKIMDMEQEKLARNLGPGHRIIHGVAGSGTTLILAYRCLQLDRMGLAKPILVLCYNKTLAASLKQILTAKGVGNRVHIYHFHGWCKTMCSLYQLDLGGDPQAPIWERRVEAVMAGVEAGRVPRAQYAGVLIDEGHDFEPRWFRLLVQMIDPATNTLLLLYDDAQSIYGQRRRPAFSWSSVGIEAKGRTTILKVNYRNTMEDLGFAYRFVSTYLDKADANAEIPIVRPEFGGRNGAVPQVRKLANATQELDHIAARLQARAGANTPYRQMAVLCRFSKQIERIRQGLLERGVAVDSAEDFASATKAIDPAAATVKVLTIHASKGLEFDSVAVPDLGCMPCAKAPRDEEARLLYVACTRATEHLLVTYHRESVFTRQCVRLQETARAA